MNRHPAVKEYLAAVHPGPILEFLLADLRRKLGIVVQTLEIRALDPQWNTFGILDEVCVGVEPGLLRQLIAARAVKVIQFKRRFYGLLGHGISSARLIEVVQILMEKSVRPQLFEYSDHEIKKGPLSVTHF